MSKYRVKIPVEYVIEINDDNETVSGPSALQGDSSLVALRRAMWILMRQDLAKIDPEVLNAIKSEQKTFGIRTLLVRGKEQDMDVTKEE